MLNGSIDNEEEAVARTTVLVAEASIKITAVDSSAGYVELTNNSDKEQNLNSWSLQTGDKKFVFPLDTIVSPWVSIKIPFRVIGLNNLNIKEIVLAYPDGEVASGANLQNNDNLLKIADLRKRLAKMRQQLAAENSLTTEEPETLTAKPSNVIVLAKELSWFQKIKNAIFK